MNTIILIMPIVLVIILMIGALYDLFNDMTIPLPVGIIGLLIKGIEMIIYERNHIQTNLISALILAFIFGIGALFGAYGGADIIFAALLGFYLGMDGIIAVGLACVLSLPHAIYLKRKNKDKAQYPFVPYLLLSTAIIVIYEYVLGGVSIW